MNKRRIVLGMVSFVLAVVALLVIDQIRQASAWASIDDEPPLEVQQVAAPTGSWFALKAVMTAVPEEHRDRIGKALREKDVPTDRRAWTLVSDQLKALSPLIGAAPIVSPTRKLGSEDSRVSLLPIIMLAKAQLLRGWEHYDGGDILAAVKAMLRVDRFGQQLIDGSQSQLMGMVGFSVQDMAIEALQEVLFVTHEPSIHTLVAERLAVQTPQDGHFRKALSRECAHIEELLIDPFKTADMALQEEWRAKGLPGTLFDQDATVAQHRQWCRAANNWLALAPLERRQPPAYLPQGLSKVLTYNVIGVQYLKIVSQERFLSHVEEDLLEGELRREVLRLLTAARRYGFAHSGDLPAHAEQLVPEYLKSLPLDPFTRAALKIESDAIKASRGERVWITLPAAPNQP